MHEWYDEPKAHMPDFRHRALRHHAEGIFLSEQIFGQTFTRKSDGKVLPTRWVGEQHVKEDLGFIPTAADWLRNLQPERWMSRSRKLSQELDAEPPEPVAAGANGSDRP